MELVIHPSFSLLVRIARGITVAAHNPLRYDPTRTGAIRKKFERTLRVRFRIFGKSLFDLIVTQDAFGLGRQEKNFERIFGATRNGLVLLGNRSNEQTARLFQTVGRVDENPIPLSLNVGQREWAFLTDELKLKEFEGWLANETGLTIVPESDRFWEEFVQEGYEKGAGRAFADSNRAELAAATRKEIEVFTAGRKSEFITTMLGAPETVQKTKLLASRVLTDLKGVNEAMATQMRRNLVDGLVQGQNPRTIARTMSRDLGIARRRAEVIARTEIVRAHAEGQLDALERMGVTEIGVAVEWDTAGDTRVCPLCAAMSGVVFKVKESHGLIPRHPQCRCAFIPANVGESKVGQVRSKSSIQKSIDTSLKQEGGKKRTLKQAKARSRWAGKSTPVAKKRPKSILD